jgi:hypothetical protein
VFDDRLSALIVDGEGITSTYNDGAGTFTIDGEDATTTNKGIASVATADFAVTSGAVTIKASGVSNAQLVNDGITIGSDDTSLGATITDLNGITSLDVDNLTIDANAITSTNANGDIELTPNGTGTVKVPSGYEGRAGFTADSVVNKTYVDAVANGLDVKKSCRVATTANLATAYHNGNGTLTASTYVLLTTESAVKPARPSYPEGTFTVPVPFGVNSMSPFALVDVIALASMVKLSTSREVIPFKSVIVAPREVSSLPIVMPSLTN